METRLRLLLVLGGLPCPETNLPVRGRTGDVLAVVDLQYPEQKIVLEYDGDLHRTERRKWRRDRAVRRAMADVGWDVHTFDADDIDRTPEQTLVRVHTALLDRGHPGTPSRPAQDWRPYFRPRHPRSVNDV